ncbi:chloride channel protein [Candidatus Woesearchaeota archaeon]|jgi:hypothetical protein|nr:chloride channel protein [Candidatus Woesearchaeota archaeon]
MAKTLQEKLLEKGWHEEEVAEAVKILGSEEAKKKNIIFYQQMSPITYWTMLIVAIIGNLIISMVLIPFLIVLPNFKLYVIIGVIGFAFGALFNLLLRSIENIDYKHHIVAGIFIPAIAVVNIYVITTLANSLSFSIEKGLIRTTLFHQNPILVSLIYVGAFVLPYVIFEIFGIK